MMGPPPALPKSAPKIVFLLYAPFKVLYQVVQMVWTLSFSVSRPSHILIQVGPTPLSHVDAGSKQAPKGS